MVLTSHLSDAYGAFSSYRVSFSLFSILKKMSLMTSLTMMVMGTGLPLNLVYLLCAHIFGISVNRVCGLSCNEVTKSVCRVR